MIHFKPTLLLITTMLNQHINLKLSLEFFLSSQTLFAVLWNYYPAVRTGSSNTLFFPWFLFFGVLTCPRPPVFARPNKYSSCLSLHSITMETVEISKSQDFIVCPKWLVYLFKKMVVVRPGEEPVKNNVHVFWSSWSKLIKRVWYPSYQGY